MRDHTQDLRPGTPGPLWFHHAWGRSASEMRSSSCREQREGGCKIQVRRRHEPQVLTLSLFELMPLFCVALFIPVLGLGP